MLLRMSQIHQLPDGRRASTLSDDTILHFFKTCRAGKGQARAVEPQKPGKRALEAGKGIGKFCPRDVLSPAVRSFIMQRPVAIVIDPQIVHAEFDGVAARGGLSAGGKNSAGAKRRKSSRPHA